MSKAVKRTYNQIASHFSRSRTVIWPDARKYTGLLQPGDSVLDLGCGNGRLLSGIKTGVDYLGVDFSQKLLEIAKADYPNRRFILADLTDPDLWKTLPNFNAVFCLGVLHHLPHREQQLFVLTKIHQHLKRSGFVYLTVWNLWRKNRIIHHFLNGSLTLKFKNFRWINTLFQRRWPMFCFAFDRRYLEQLVRQAGFTKFHCQYFDKAGMPAEIFTGQNLTLFAKK